MNPNEKKEILRSLSEKQFRQELIIPLLSKIGYIAPIEYHGVNERGKDIVCFEYDRLKEQRFLAVVAKIGDLTGNASTNSGLMTIVNQVHQAFDNPYEDLYNMRQVFINEVWVMTTGKIVSGAQDSVINTLRKNNLDKQIRIIGDDRLIQLIDKHFSTYWNSSNETKESVIIQRDRLISFIENLLEKNNVDKATIESVKASILYSSFDPRISNTLEGLHISNVSPYSIELARMDAKFDDYIVSKTFGVTKEIFQEAKQQLRSSFYDIEQTIDHADRISKLTNPWDFVIETDSWLLREYPFHTNSWGSSNDFVSSISYMEEGLRELKFFKDYLSYKGKLFWAKKISKSVIDLLPEITDIINNSKEDKLKINYRIDEDNEVVKIEYDNNHSAICFSTEFTRIEEKGFKRNKDGSIKPNYVIGLALRYMREHIEKVTEYDEDVWLRDYVEDDTV